MSLRGAGRPLTSRAMNVLVLGASGGVGRHVVRLAAEQGHALTVVSRTALEVPAGVRLVVDDVARPGCLDAVMPGQQAVLSSLGIKRKNPANPWSALASPPDFSSRTARLIVDAMRAHGVRRVIAVSAAGVGDSAPGLNLVMRVMLATSRVGDGYRDLEALERVYAGSGLDWCCPRPTRLTNGPQTGRVRVIDDFPMTAAISRADVAWWMVEHLAGPLEPRTPTITGA